MDTSSNVIKPRSPMLPESLNRPPPRARPPQQPSLAWQVILLAVVSSVVTSAAMFMGLNHFNAPAATPAPVSTLNALTQIMVPTKAGPHDASANNGSATGYTDGPGASQASAGAASVLNIVQVVRDSGQNFASNSIHQALYADLMMLNLAAKDVAKNPSAESISKMSAALDEAISRADNISQRRIGDSTQELVAGGSEHTAPVSEADVKFAAGGANGVAHPQIIAIQDFNPAIAQP
jgi:hypothetical protein